MTLSVSSNTGGRISITFLNDASNPLDISAFTIDVQILADISGSPLSIADGGLSLAVSGDDSNVLTISIPDGHGMSAGAYPVQGRYHTGDGNWLDLFKGELIVAARGGCGGWSVTCGTGDGIDGGIVAVSGPYLPLAGGTVTGDLTLRGSFRAEPSDLSGFTAGAQTAITGAADSITAIQSGSTPVGLARYTLDIPFANQFKSEITAGQTLSPSIQTANYSFEIISKNLTAAYGLSFGGKSSGSSVVTAGYGVRVGMSTADAGAMVDAYQFYADAPIAVGGDITRLFDFYARASYAASVDAVDRYGVYIDHRGLNHFGGPVRMGNYTLATLPSAADSGAGAMIYLSDEAGGPTMAFSDGSNWRRTTDNAVVS